MRYDDDDDDDNKGNDDEQELQPGGETGNYNFGDDFGTRIGEGHDPAAEPV